LAQRENRGLTAENAENAEKAQRKTARDARKAPPWQTEDPSASLRISGTPEKPLTRKSLTSKEVSYMKSLT
jgi:hypothetical protein